MRLALHILGTEVVALTTDRDDQDGPGDAIATPLGFTQGLPHMTDGRYGIDDDARGAK